VSAGLLGNNWRIAPAPSRFGRSTLQFAGTICAPAISWCIFPAQDFSFSQPEARMLKSRRNRPGARRKASKIPCYRLLVEKLSGGPGTTKMRILAIVVICAALGGCWTSGQEAATSNRPGDQFIGQNVDAVVARFGKPTGRKKLDNDQMSYVWELDATPPSSDQKTHSGQGGLYGDGQTPGYMSDDPRFCKLSVTTSPEGIVTQFNAEDSNGTGASAMSLGFNRSICAQRLGMRPQT
jgi:hypothetical protein